MTTIPTITLNDGVEIPALGFGVYQIPADGSPYTYFYRERCLRLLNK